MVQIAQDIDAEARKIAASLRRLFPADQIRAAIASDGGRFGKYQSDPVGFIREVLGESPTDDVVRMMESVRDNQVTIAKSANGTGKTWGAARVAVWFRKAFPESQVYTAAAPPEDNLRRLLWGEIYHLVEKHPKLFAQDRTTADLAIESSPREFLVGVTIPASARPDQIQARFSGKHAPNLLFIFDEGDAIPDPVYLGAEACMSGGNVRMLIMFNPRAQIGTPYRMERDRQANVVALSAFGHPNVITGEDVIPGAVSREITVRRINDWCRPLAAGEKYSEAECFTLPDFLVGAKAKTRSGGEYPPLVAGDYQIVVPHFAHMVLGRYPSQSVNQLISAEWVALARARYDEHTAKFGEVPPRGVRAIMGLDCADQGVDRNVAAFRYGGWLSPVVEWSNVDMIETGDRGQREYSKRDVVAACVDSTGVGAGVAPHMRRLGCNAHSVMVGEAATKACELGNFAQLRDQLWWAYREWLRLEPTAMLPPDEELIEETLAPRYWFDQRGRIKITPKRPSKADETGAREMTLKQILGRSPDKAEAVIMTFFEYSKMPTTVNAARRVEPVNYAYV